MVKDGESLISDSKQLIIWEENITTILNHVTSNEVLPVKDEIVGGRQNETGGTITLRMWILSFRWVCSFT